MAKAHKKITYLKRQKNNAYKLEREMRNQLAELSQRTDEARLIEEEKWNDYYDAREDMKEEFEALEVQRSLDEAIWATYKHVRDKNNQKIGELNAEIFECDDEKKIGEIRREISFLAREIKTEKMKAEYMSTGVDSSKYQVSKDIFQEKRKEHRAAKLEFELLVKQCKELRTAIDRQHDDYVEKKNIFFKALRDSKRRRHK
ncbi:hypothetical protein IJ096_01125 [Candidatus Saccharibacteria bacterium]|nr:hypothetical protein [Candidatus Saccharibacteria bacterium]